jgi:hypothetical protein
MFIVYLQASKPCCLLTSSRLNQLASQLRLYAVLEDELHALVHCSCSCSCGQFQRSYKTFRRSNKK